jgi:hypothetical protein
MQYESEDSQQPEYVDGTAEMAGEMVMSMNFSS